MTEHEPPRENPDAAPASSEQRSIGLDALTNAIPRSSRIVRLAVTKGAAIVFASAWLGTILNAQFGDSLNGGVRTVLILLLAIAVFLAGFWTAGWAPADPLHNAALAGALGFGVAGGTASLYRLTQTQEVTVASVVSVVYFALFASVVATIGALIRARQLRQNERQQKGR